MDGFYAIYFTGYLGSNIGIIVFKDGIIVGADAGNGIYDGEYTIDEKRSKIKGKLQVSLPPNSVFVTGAQSNQVNQKMIIPFYLPKDLGSGNPIEIKTQTGPVNVIFKKLRNFPE